MGTRNQCTIRKVSNGYVVENNIGREFCFMTLDDALNFLLFAFEARNINAGGDSYGVVIILREDPTQPRAQPPPPEQLSLPLQASETDPQGG